MDTVARNWESQLNDDLQHDALTDEGLAQRVKQGCRDSFALLDRRIRPRLIHLLSIRLANHTDAEDVAQQTMLRVFEKIQQYDDRRRFRSWVFTIAMRLAIDYQRGQRDQPIRPEDSLMQIVDPSPRPDQQAVATEERNGLWTLVGRVLRPEQHTALWLFYGEQQSAAEIAATMQRSVIAVRVSLYRARKALLPHLEDYADLADVDGVADDSTNGCPAAPQIAEGVQL